MSDSHYVYRCYDHNDRLIYVGVTKNVPQRMTLHRNRQSDSRWWQDQVAEVSVKEYGNRRDAEAMEEEAILTENPRWNVKIKDKTMHLWELSDFDDYFTSLSRVPYFQSVGPNFYWRLAEQELARRFPELFTRRNVSPLTSP